MPARAPASMDMLHTVMRSSMFSARMAGPRNSMTWPVPPDTPILPMMARTRSLAVTPGRSLPSTLMASVFGRVCSRHCVASTWPTSVVPMPKARAPNAPCVLVWLSPQTMVLPGCVAPSSGPITCTMPRLSLAMSMQLDAELGAVDLQLPHLPRRRLDRDRHAAEHLLGAVGVE